MQAQKRRSRGRRVLLHRCFRPDVERQLTALQRLLDAAQLAGQSPERGEKTSPRGKGAVAHVAVDSVIVPEAAP